MAEPPGGPEKLRPDDHFLVLLESEETPMHIGSLLVLDIADSDRASAAQRLRDHLVGRLPHTPLLRALRRAPLGFDSDVWVRVDDPDLEWHVTIDRADAPLSDRDLDAFVENHVMERLDLSRPPFQVRIIDPVADGEHGGRIAMYVRVHHAFTDGVGFQHLLGMLSDDGAAAAPTRLAPPEDLPSRHDWLRGSAAEFRASRPGDANHRDARKAALRALEDPDLRRSPTPECVLSGPTSTGRAYGRVTLPFEELRRAAHFLEATVNDLFLAVVGSAVREHLLERGALPELPLVTNSARSYRRDEHGLFGNRIVAMHPHLATHVEDPVGRLRAIQASMAAEKRRTVHDEALLNQPETPFGPMTRRARFARRVGSGANVLPGNVTVSNVPGPDHVRYFAGFAQRSNHPAPLLGSGRAINFTARRNAGSFDVGIMCDAAKVDGVSVVAAGFRRAWAAYAALAGIGS